MLEDASVISELWRGQEEVSVGGNDEESHTIVLSSDTHKDEETKKTDTDLKTKPRKLKSLFQPRT